MHSTDKETLAVVRCIKRFYNEYLRDGKTFIVFTDCNFVASTFAKANKNKNTKYVRWMRDIQGCKFCILHKPAKNNHLSDHLSRIVETMPRVFIKELERVDKFSPNKPPPIPLHFNLIPEPEKTQTVSECYLECKKKWNFGVTGSKLVSNQEPDESKNETELKENENETNKIETESKEKDSIDLELGIKTELNKDSNALFNEEQKYPVNTLHGNELLNTKKTIEINELKLPKTPNYIQQQRINELKQQTESLLYHKEEQIEDESIHIQSNIQQNYNYNWDIKNIGIFNINDIKAHQLLCINEYFDNELLFKNGLYYSKDHKLWIPESIQERILRRIHELNAHCGIQQLIKLNNQDYFIYNVTGLAEEIIRNCYICRLIRYKARPAPTLKLRNSQFFNDIIQIDFKVIRKTGPYILVIIDYHSNYVFLSYKTSRGILQTIETLMEYFSIYGTPKEIVSDKEFVAGTVMHLCSKHNIKLHFGSDSRSKGKVERINREIDKLLKILYTQHKLKNNNKFHGIKFRILFKMIQNLLNSRVQTNLFTPNEIVFGFRNSNGITDVDTELDNEEFALLRNSKSIKEYMEILTDIRTLNGYNIKYNNQMVREKLQKRFMEKHSSSYKIKLGDFVMISKESKSIIHNKQRIYNQPNNLIIGKNEFNKYKVLKADNSIEWIHHRNLIPYNNNTIYQTNKNIFIKDSYLQSKENEMDNMETLETLENVLQTDLSKTETNENIIMETPNEPIINTEAPIITTQQISKGQNWFDVYSSILMEQTKDINISLPEEIQNMDIQIPDIINDNESDAFVY